LDAAGFANFANRLFRVDDEVQEKPDQLVASPTTGGRFSFGVNVTSIELRFKECS